jgi:DNA-binding transcriptional LysR family regulator
VLLDVVNELTRANVEVNIAEAMTAEQMRLLESGDIDVGVLRYPFDARGLKISAPLRQPLGVLMHSSHPLAARASVALSELQPYPLVHFQRHFAPGLYDELLELCRAGGYAPQRILHGVRMTAALLTSESAVSLATERLLNRRGQAGTREFVWKPISGEPIGWWTSAVCRANDWDSLTRLAVGVVVNALQAHENWVPHPRPGNAARRRGKKPA